MKAEAETSKTREKKIIAIPALVFALLFIFRLFLFLSNFGVLSQEREKMSDVGFVGQSYVDDSYTDEITQNIESTMTAEFSGSNVPNDTFYNKEVLGTEFTWGLNSDNGIHADNAWKIARGKKNIRVGIIDSGIYPHVDLKDNLADGWDFYNNNAITTDDEADHGTHVAGIIGAVGNNGEGIPGVNWEVTLVPMQTIRDDKLHYSDEVKEAIKWATSKWGTSEQIDVLNYSVGGYGNLDVELIDDIKKFPGLFVWSAGNDKDDVDLFPAISKYNLPNLISVGAISKNYDMEWSGDKKNGGSNYSSSGKYVNIYAPGIEIFSTASGESSYQSTSGTSMAAPYVTGAAALMLSVNPDLTANQLKNIIIESADTIEATLPNKTIQKVKKLNLEEAIKKVAFTTNSTGNEIVSASQYLSDYVEVPTEINNKTINSIASMAFMGNENLIEILIPEGITKIGSGAFNKCYNLTTIQVPFVGGYKAVGAASDNTFFGYIFGATKYENQYQYVPETLQNVIITGGSYIDSYAFYNCRDIQTITIPNTVETFGIYSFYGCESVSTISIPASVKNIGAYSFANCIALNKVWIYGTKTWNAINYWDESNVVIFTILNNDGTQKIKKYGDYNWRR